ncbi:MAG: YdcF family protein [Tatlockia sp.]|nr:YdcF family protein [Tatlockia sp.]
MTIFFILRHLFEVILNPFFLILLLFVFFLILLWLSATSLFIRIGFLSVFILFILFSSGWLVEGLTRTLEDGNKPLTKVSPSIRWVVVLSGGQAQLTNLPTNDILYGISIKRLIEGLRIYRQLPGSKMLLSGGGYGSDLSEAAHLAELATWFAIPARDIVLETRSMNTVEQVKAIKQFVHDEPFYLVTSAIHMPRSICLCHANGLNPIAAPTDFTLYWSDKLWPIRYLPNAHNFFYLSIAMHELLGKTWAKIRGDC